MQCFLMKQRLSDPALHVCFRLAVQHSNAAVLPYGDGPFQLGMAWLVAPVPWHDRGLAQCPLFYCGPCFTAQAMRLFDGLVPDLEPIVLEGEQYLPCKWLHSWQGTAFPASNPAAFLLRYQPAQLRGTFCAWEGAVCGLSDPAPIQEWLAWCTAL